MATETTNYNLSKAVVGEFYDVLKVNANTDKIDEQMKKNEIAAKKFARFVIGTSFNSQGWAAHNCNYLCDGVADQVEINAAIAALPATGGEIVILDGVYDLKAPIEMNKANITIRGNGKATELKTNWNAIALDGNINISADNCMIKDLYLNSVAIRTYNIGIYIISGSGNTVSNVKTKAYKHGILINAASNTNIITDNICTEGTYGITVSSSNSTIKNNICNANTVGISIRTSNNTVNGNTVENNTNYGIELLDAIQNAVVCNNCYNNKKGICLITSASNTIVGNTCLRGTGLSIDYAADQDTIYVYNGCLNNLISNNNCLGKAINIINPANGNSNINNKWDASDDIKEIRESINALATYKGVLINNSVNQSIPNGIFTELTWNTVAYDIGGFYNVLNPTRLTIPSGVSKVRLAVNASFRPNASGARQIQIQKNGASLVGGGEQLQNATGGDDALNLTTAVVDVVVGDYFTARALQSSGGSLNTNYYANPHWFSLEVVK